MKKIFLLALTIGLSLVGNAQRTYSPSASTDVYDFTGIGDDLIELFYNAFKQGRNYPTQAELESKGINMLDLNFVRSHVRPRSIMVEHSKDINQDVTEGRRLWLNMPMGMGKTQGGYPNNNGSDDCFTLWNYTNLFGSWNNWLFHSSGVWTDCAHKNGSDIMSGIKFFESWGTGDGDWVNVVSTKNDLTTGPSAGDKYKYSRAIIYALMFMGQDGINYNWEDASYSKTDVVKFHQELYKIANEVGFTNYHSGIYTSNNSVTARTCESLYGNKTNGKTHDLMLNYDNGDFTTESNMSSSVTTAKNTYGNADGLYTGVWMCTVARSWSNLAGRNYPEAKNINVCLWGEHSQSRIYSNTRGDDPVKYADNYQKMQERFASGGNRNPLLRPTETNEADWGSLENFQGLAEYIPERTAIQGDLPFITYFNTGAGERFNYKGKKTLGKWYNMGCQDIVPTYRWLVYRMGTTTPVGDAPEFTQDDAYTGGSCLRLKGTEQDIVLYRTRLKVNGRRPTASVALKCMDTQYSGVSLIVKVVGNNTWKETPLNEVSSNMWEEQTVSLQGVLMGDEIEYIGLRTNGDANGIMVGKLAIMDDNTRTPANIKDVMVEVKEETTNAMSIKLAWEVDGTPSSRADYNLLYNDEANIDHFEVLYKNGEAGRVSMVAKTTGWAALIPNLSMEMDEEPYVGVRPVSVDGQTYGNLIWTKVERSTDVPEPSANGNYPESIISADAEGYAKAIETRYLRTFTTSGASGKNINYSQDSHPCSDGTNYYLASKNELVVKQGDRIKATFKVNGTSSDDQDGLYYCGYKAYMDFDQNYMFSSNNDEVLDEYIVKTGEGGVIADNQTADYLFDKSGHSFTFDIPEDAVTGPSRLRVVFSDAWFPHPGPSGYTQKGFTIDFPVTITGTNPGREADEDLHDQGVADEPDGLIPTSIDEVHSGKVPQISLQNGVFVISGADRIWIYTEDGRYVGNDINLGGKGTYLVRMQSGNVIRTRKIVK